MPGRLLISDANIFIDMTTGGLLALMFQLDVTFAVPNTLFEEELIGDHPELPGLGLESIELLEDAVVHASELAQRYQPTGVSINDLLALALARQEKCPLLTGDAKLRAASERERIEVHGTLWLVEQMVQARIVNDDNPGGKWAGLDRTATAELDQQNECKDRSRGRAGERPRNGVRDMKEI